MKKLFLCFSVLAMSACAKNPPPNPLSRFSGPSVSVMGGGPVEPESEVARHVVALEGTSSDGHYLCTAVIVASNAVLTAAHCAHDIQGGKLVFSTDMSTATEIRPVNGRAVNPQFELTLQALQNGQDPSQLRDWGDLALLTFKGRLPSGYAPISIADASQLQRGEPVLLAGYGLTDGENERPSNQLRSVQLPVLDPNYAQGEFTIDQNRHMGVCHGDSGGPAFIEVDNELLLAGITSRGFDANCTTAAVFTRVSAFTDWLDQKMN